MEFFSLQYIIRLATAAENSKKPLMIRNQDADVLSEIFKTVFEIFLAQILRKLQFNVVEPPKTACDSQKRQNC